MKQPLSTKVGPLPITGTHILAEAILENGELLMKSVELKPFLEKTLTKLGIVKLGSIYHDFPEGGFTCLIGLAESHISIHTWPDTYFLTMDTYLCNYSTNNEELAKKLHSKLIEYFRPERVHSRIIYR